MEAALVVVLMVILSLVVEAVDVREGRVYLRINVGVLLNLPLDLRQHLEAIVVQAEVVLLFSLGD